MDQGANGYLELLEERIEVLNALAISVKAASAAVVSFDIAKFEAQIEEQERLCIELWKRDQRILQHQKKRNDSSARNGNGAEQKTVQRMQQAEEAARSATALHQSVVRRSNHTVTALLHSMEALEGTYPRAIPLPASERTQFAEQV